MKYIKIVKTTGGNEYYSYELRDASTQTETQIRSLL
jgi:hypothetical protein